MRFIGAMQMTQTVTTLTEVVKIKAG